MPGSRRRDDRPPVEIVSGPTPADAGLTQVTVSRGRSGGTGEPPGGGRRVPLGTIAAAVAAAGLVAALVASGTGRDDARSTGDDGAPTSTSVDGDLGTTTTRRSLPPRSTRPPPTDEVTVGPILPEAEGIGLVLVADRRRLELVDLASGDRHELDDHGGDVWRTPVAVGGGMVIPGHEGSSFVDLAGGEQVVPLPAADDALATSDGELVWLVSYGHSSVDGETTAVLVDPRRGAVGSPVGISAGYVLGADRAGLVTTVYDATFLITRDGERRFLASGVALGVGGGAAAVATCADDGRCRMVLVDLETGASSAVPAALAADGHGPHSYQMVRVGPERQVVVTVVDLSDRASSSSTTVVDAGGRVLARLERGDGHQEPIILPDWSGMLLRNDLDGGLRWFPFDGSEAEPRELPGRYRADMIVGVVLPVRGP